MSDTMVLEFRGGLMRFSAGHFTIFSPKHRESIHGHNYHLEATVTAAAMEPGITFDYGVFRDKLISLCKSLHSHFLIAGDSPYLSIVEDETYYRVTFNGEEMPFLKRDIIVLPLTNITIEELSRWFMLQIKEDHEFITTYAIRSFSIAVFNGDTHGGRSFCQCS